jgi:hypothetical protein
MKLTTVLMLRKMAVAGLCAVGLATFAVSAKANLITNGSFSSNGGGGQIGFNTTAAGWTVPSGSTSSYFFLFPAGTVDGPGVTGQYGNVQMWGPGNGVPNGMPASSPDGGAFVGSDPAFQNGALSQTVGGLTAGAQYQLTFYWAGAQQKGFDGITTEGWQVTFGSQTQSTPTVTTPNHGFSPWQLQSFTFTANSSSQVLSFLATGGPSASIPPFSLLDGVSLNQVTTTPEPGSWTMLLGGLGLLGGMRFTRAKNWFKR